MKYLFVSFALLSIAPLAMGEDQSGLKGELNSSFRSIAGSPEGTYGSGILRLDVAPNSSVYLSGTTGKVDRVAAGGKVVYFGGRDAEGGFRYHVLERLDCSLGVSLPSTYVDSSREITYGLSYRILGGYAVAVRGFFGPDGASAIELSKETALSSSWSVHLGAATLFSGHSTVSANTGESIRTLLCDAELKHSFGAATVSLGLTNRLGDTTRFSLASPVGNHYGTVVGFGVKF